MAKIAVAKHRGEQVPVGWLVDKDGRDTTDPQDLYDGGALVPMGGPVSSHKGYGLGLFSAILGGLAMVGDEDPTPVASNLQLTSTEFPARSEDNWWLAGVFITIIDPSNFGNEYSYIQELDGLRSRAHIAVGDPEKIAFPGEYESNTLSGNHSQTVDLPDSVVQELEELGREIGLHFPNTTI